MRKEREDEYLRQRGGSFVSFSPDLITGAHALLSLAMQERARPVVRTRENHHASHAVGAIVLIVNAFDSWVNEVVHALGLTKPEVLPLALSSTYKKYRDLPAYLGKPQTPDDADLRLLLEVRNEIVHHLPRDFGSPDRVPARLRILNERGLFLRSGREDVDFTLSQKLASYALAWWAHEVIDRAVFALVAAVGDDAVVFEHTAQNFRAYHAITSPAKLQDFDRERGLEVTWPDATLNTTSSTQGNEGFRG